MRWIPLSFLERLVGHYTFAMLVRRESLSVFSQVYRVISTLRAGRRCDRSAWRAARAELEMASSLLPLLRAPLSLPWSPIVYATDSSDSGFGICQRTMGSQRVAQVGKVAESWRYSFEDCVHARRSSLLFDPTLLDPTDPAGSARHIREEAAGLVAEFSEVGDDVLEFSRWSTVYSGRWLYQQDIVKTEGRALVWSARHKFRTSHSFARGICI